MQVEAAEKKVVIEDFFGDSKKPAKTERTGGQDFRKRTLFRPVADEKARLVPAIRVGPVEVHPQPCVAPRHFGLRRKLLLRSSAAHGSRSSSRQAQRYTGHAD